MGSQQRAGGQYRGLQVRLLGPVQVHSAPGQQTIALGAHRDRALLARLALDADRWVPVERLIDDLWGTSPPLTARNTLQVYVSHLRRRLPAELIGSGPGGYELTIEPAAVDVHQFSQEVSSGRALHQAGSSAQAVQILRGALELWRGEPLNDLADYEFARMEAARLGELRAAALEDLAEALLACGAHDEVVRQLARTLQEYPFRERLRAAVMTALYRSGDAAGALAVYRDGRQILREELGLEPGPALRALQAAILSEDEALVAAAPSVTRSLDAVAPPAPTTALLGRAVELAELTTLTERRSVRLVNVLGAGGTGKTRLALELARHPARSFAQSTVWTELADLGDAARALPAIGASVRLRAPELDLAQVSAALQGGDTLLVLDNTEHLLPDIADTVSALLATCPELTIVVTSRAALQIAGEHRFQLGPLPAPDKDAGLAEIEANPAVQLFCERATQVKPAFRLTDEAAPTVAQICRRLDGLPLAVELAAARAALLDPTAMLGRLESRLTMLTTAPRDAPKRHHSLRETIDWSYRLLSPQARRIFALLAVFRGGFTLETVEAVAQGNSAAEDAGLLVADAVQELLDASLITADPDGRMRMLETIAEYAGERLTDSGDEDIAQAAHCAYFRATLTHRSAKVPLQPRTGSELSWFEQEQENLRAAIAWAARHDHEALVDLAAQAAPHWDDLPDWSDFEPWLRQAAEHATGIRGFDTEYWLALSSVERGLIRDSSALARLGLALRHLGNEDEPERRALALAKQGLLAYFTGDTRAALRFAQAAATAADDIEDLDIRALTLGTAGAAISEGDAELARRLLLRAMNDASRTGNLHVLWNTANGLAELAVTVGDADEAVRLCRDVLQLQPLSDADLAYVLEIMGAALVFTGDLARARAALREALRLAVKHSLSLASEVVLVFAALASASGDLATASTLLGFREAALGEREGELVGSSLRIYQQFLADLPQRLGPEKYETYKQRGAALDQQQIVNWLLHDQPPPEDMPIL